MADEERSLAFPSLVSKAALGGGGYLRLLSPLSQALPCLAPDLLSSGPEPPWRRRFLALAPKLLADDYGPWPQSSRRWQRLPALGARGQGSSGYQARPPCSRRRRRLLSPMAELQVSTRLSSRQR
ncbi:hypothetical protein E2562_021562 [Oryza meyeriana var. granulata]|uniref:Uncharacterized protein n=1 Tax=Oryza meyeriana var. granulata TaxID=110450 RepID=A0A6G1EXY3_9ORYZ|nr:hypothetical protein E2562_021562 [Oryza meyeriana var. granulata]